MTRAFISISHGQFGNAWTFNPGQFRRLSLYVGTNSMAEFSAMLRIRRGKPSNRIHLAIRTANHHGIDHAFAMDLSTCDVNRNAISITGNSECRAAFDN